MVVLGCVCCLMAFVTFVVGFVGDVGSSDGKMWLSGGAGLCVVCFAFDNYVRFVQIAKDMAVLLKLKHYYTSILR